MSFDAEARRRKEMKVLICTFVFSLAKHSSRLCVFAANDHMKSDYDILIIGGGMVGASLACALGGTGLRIAVVEAVPLTASVQPSYDERTIALAFGSRRIFEGIGVWDEVARLGTTPIEKIHISDRGRFGFTHLSRAELGLEALGYVVGARVLGLALLARLQQLPNVAWLCPATLEHINFEVDSARTRVRHDGVLCDLSARLVVAADGADSAVRSVAGIDFERTQYGQSAVVTTVTINQPHNNTAYERFTETGPLALLPMSDNRMAVVWSMCTDNVETLIGLSDEEYLARLQERFGDRLGPLTRLGKTARLSAYAHARERARTSAACADRQRRAHGASGGGAGVQSRTARCRRARRSIGSRETGKPRPRRFGSAQTLRGLARARQ